MLKISIINWRSQINIFVNYTCIYISLIKNHIKDRNLPTTIKAILILNTKNCVLGFFFKYFCPLLYKFFFNYKCTINKAPDDSRPINKQNDIFPEFSTINLFYLIKLPIIHHFFVVCSSQWPSCLMFVQSLYVYVIDALSLFGQFSSLIPEDFTAFWFW